MSAGQTSYPPSQTILLTGAGFTKSFDGYLASEMWATIFSQSEIQELNNLRKFLLSNFDYEWVYDQVVFSKQPQLNFTDREKLAFIKAVRAAYEQMHRIVCRDEIDHRVSASAVCHSLISRFAGSGNKRGFFFTLNHDLLVEAFYSNGERVNLVIPGLQNPKWFNGRLGPELEPGDHVQLKDEATVEKIKAEFCRKSAGQFVYVKLHGSYGWKAKDGADVMVIGHAKTESLEREPLLKWYLSLFREALNKFEQKLVIIGYGFGDEHINGVIAEAISKFKLRFYVISPKSPTAFREMLLKLDSQSIPSGDINLKLGSTLWFGLAGYYQGEVKDFYWKQNEQLTPKAEAFLRGVGLL